MSYSNLINTLPTILMILLTVAILWLAYEARKSSYRGALYNNQILGYIELRELAMQLMFQLLLYIRKTNSLEKIETYVENLKDKFFIKLLKYGDIMQKDLFGRLKKMSDLINPIDLSQTSKEELKLNYDKIKQEFIEAQKIAEKVFCLKGLNKESEKLLK